MGGLSTIGTSPPFPSPGKISFSRPRPSELSGERSPDLTCTSHNHPPMTDEKHPIISHQEDSSPMSARTYSKFLRFLQEDLALSHESIAVIKRHSSLHYDSLPMVLWQYGLITLDELDRIFDWLENAVAASNG